ncbi:MAG: hypothetical protein H6732_16350 [Alphaproteobacteria bacterium]|nr:hypothetical protein [Alphaproteobacteria bacterium]
MSCTRALSACALALVGTACGPSEPGHYYELAAAARADACGGLRRGDDGLVTYRLVADGAEVELWVAGEASAFATGTLRSCTLTYASREITEARDVGSITWRLTGEATVTAGDGCAAGEGWVGAEVVEVVESSSPTVPAGCQVEVDVEGAWVGEVR